MSCETGLVPVGLGYYRSPYLEGVEQLDDVRVLHFRKHIPLRLNVRDLYTCRWYGASERARRNRIVYNLCVQVRRQSSSAGVSMREKVCLDFSSHAYCAAAGA